MKKIKNILSLALVLLASNSLFAQDAAEEWAGEDKYNVVIGVLSVIFLGIIIYLIVIDRKIAKLEKQKKDNNS